MLNHTVEPTREITLVVMRGWILNEFFK